MDQYQTTGGGQPTMPSGESGNKSSSLLIGGIILLIVLALLGWYVVRGQGGGVAERSASEPDRATTALSAQGTSDETAAIEADLNATDLNSLNDINQL